MVMVVKSLCRERTANCRRLAEGTSDPVLRKHLLDVARTWEQLALKPETIYREDSSEMKIDKWSQRIEEYHVMAEGMKNNDARNGLYAVIKTLGRMIDGERGLRVKK